MIAEIGQFALVLALLVALVQGTLPLVGAARGETRLMALARPAALAQFLFVLLAFCALTGPTSRPISRSRSSPRIRIRPSR